MRDCHEAARATIGRRTLSDTNGRGHKHLENPAGCIPYELIDVPIRRSEGDMLLRIAPARREAANGTPSSRRYGHLRHRRQILPPIIISIILYRELQDAATRAHADDMQLPCCGVACDGRAVLD